jgi:hypothetical protein
VSNLSSTYSTSYVRKYIAQSWVTSVASAPSKLAYSDILLEWDSAHPDQFKLWYNFQWVGYSGNGTNLPLVLMSVLENVRRTSIIPSTSATRLTPIIHHHSRGYHCESHIQLCTEHHHYTSFPQTCIITVNSKEIDCRPENRIIWGECHSAGSWW